MSLPAWFEDFTLEHCLIDEVADRIPASLRGKVESRKVFYASNRGKKDASKMDFAAQVPLWPGSNMITVVARENNEVKTAQTIWVHRNGGPSKTAQVTP